MYASPIDGVEGYLDVESNNNESSTDPDEFEGKMLCIHCHVCAYTSWTWSDLEIASVPRIFSSFTFHLFF